MYNLTCTPKGITSYLLSITGILLTANFFVVHRKLVAPDPVLRGFRAAFYFGGEANFPSFFTALLIFACALILWKASELPMNSKRESSCFRMLSVFVLLLTLEHFFGVHELFFDATGQVLGIAFSQYFQLTWFIISALFFLAISVCIVVGFLFLPARLKVNFFTSAILYASGVIVRTVIQPSIHVAATYKDVFISLTETFSLLLQMIAVISFLHVLLSFYLMHVKSPDIRLTFFAPQADDSKSDHYDDRITEIV
jgi:hypothetical protein